MGVTFPVGSFTPLAMHCIGRGSAPLVGTPGQENPAPTKKVRRAPEARKTDSLGREPQEETVTKLDKPRSGDRCHWASIFLSPRWGSPSFRPLRTWGY